MKSKLSTKITALIVISLLATLLIVSSFTIYKFLDNTEEMVYSKVSDQNKATVNQIHMKITDMETIVSIISQSTAIKSYLTGDGSAADSYDYLLQTKEGSDIIESLVLVDRDKIGVMSNTSNSLDLDLTTRTYFENPDNGIIGISEPTVSAVTGNTVIAFVNPIYQNSEHIGYLIATIDFEEIRSIVNSIQIFDNGYAYMYNSEGITISHPIAEYQDTLDMSTLNITFIDEMITNTNNNIGGSGQYTYEGEEKYVEYLPLDNWGIAVVANKSDYMRTTNQVTLFVIILAIVLSLIMIVGAVFFARSVLIKPIKKIESAMNIAGDGDLTIQTSVKNKDEIGQISQSFNHMINSQRHILNSVDDSSTTLHYATNEISQSSQQVSESSTFIANNASELASIAMNQNDGVTQASEIILQLSALVEEAKSNATTADENVAESLAAAEEGRKSVEETLSSIDQIRISSDNTNASLGEVYRLSEQIKGVIETINSISSQTNLLALNASIEAARAGEHGKGFSIVAEEVRKLAEQTGAEANQISTVIGEMTTRIEEAVSLMSTNKDTVDTGVEKAKNTDQRLIQILEAFNKVNEDIKKIEHITDEEVEISEAVINIITDIGELSNKNSASAQDIAAAVEEQTALLENISASSQEINSMSAQLSEIVHTFKLT